MYDISLTLQGSRIKLPKNVLVNDPDPTGHDSFVGQPRKNEKNSFTMASLISFNTGTGGNQKSQLIRKIGGP